MTTQNINDYVDAVDYADDCFEKQRAILNAMHRSLNTGCQYTIEILNEKASKTLAQVIVETAFAFALDVIPGGIVLTKRWKAFAKTNEVLLERLDYVKSTLQNAGKSIQTITQATGADAKPDPQSVVAGNTKASLLINKLHNELKLINKALAQTFVEEALYKEYLKVLRDQGCKTLLTNARQDVHNPQISASQLNNMPIAFTYKLLAEYARKNVTFIKEYHEHYDVHSPGYITKGFNNEQMKRISEMFGKQKMLSYRLDKHKVKPITGAQDMIDHWKVRVIKKTVRMPTSSRAIGF